MTTRIVSVLQYFAKEKKKKKETHSGLIFEFAYRANELHTAVHQTLTGLRSVSLTLLLPVMMLKSPSVFLSQP